MELVRLPKEAPLGNTKLFHSIIAGAHIKAEQEVPQNYGPISRDTF